MSNTMHISSEANMLFMCRLCGTEFISQDEVLNIFDTNGLALNIKSKIANCLGLIVNQNDFLPKILCAECVDNLEKFNEFKIKSNDTALYLINFLVQNQISDSRNKPNKPLIQTGINRDNTLNFCEVLIKEEIDELSNIPSQVSNVQNPSFNVNKTQTKQLGTNNRKKGFSNHTRSTHVQSVPKTNIDKVKPKSCDKNSKKIYKTESKREINYSEYKCEHCPYVRNTKLKILKHISYHLSKLEGSVCTVCDIKLSSKQALSAHMKLHNKQYRYICNYCGKGFLGKTGFEVHVRAAHTKEYPFHCTKCDKKFTSKGNLKLHIQVAHNDECNFTCDVCNRSFKTKNYLQTHKKRHLPKEIRLRFKCNVCESGFGRNAELKKHMLVHTDETKFECEHCDKRYKEKSGLQIHMLTHTGERSHVCDECGTAFALNSNLVNHRRIHTGERPYKCNACQKRFSQKSALNRHKKTCLKA